MTGNGLGVIAGGHRDDATGAFGLGQQRQPVGRAAFLEGAGHLKVIQLEHDIATRCLRDGMAGQGRGAHHATGDACGRGFDIGEGDHGGNVLSSSWRTRARHDTGRSR